MKHRLAWTLFICAALLAALMCQTAIADSPVVPEDGLYTAWVTSSSDMFRIVKCVLRVEGGEMTATLTMSGQGYGYLFVGTSAEADAAPEDSWVPFQLDADGSKTFSIRIPALDQDLDVAAYSIKYSKWYDRVLNFQSGSLKPYDAPRPSQQPGEAAVPPDGEYSVAVTSDSALLSISDCTVKVDGGKIVAHLTVGNQNYDYLYAGLAKDARGDEKGWIPATGNGDGTCSFILPVPALGVDVPVATRSAQKGMWYDRTLRFDPGALPDGAYVPDEFSFSGGTGKVSITCPKVTVKSGQAVATIVFDSQYYAYVKVGGNKYDGSRTDSTSTFDIPVRLDADNPIIGMTTRMSTDHEIEYTLYIHIAAAGANTASQGVDAPELGGLRYTSTMELSYAQCFDVYNYEGGYRLIDVHDSARYLVVPEHMPVPDGLGADVVVLKKPLENIYLAATSAMALFDTLDALDAVSMTGTDESGWYIENAVKAMRDGRMVFAGRYSEPDYELLLDRGCSLAIESTMILHVPKVQEMIELVGIPVFIDRSSYETHPLGRTEWIKLYSVLVDREDRARAFFDEQKEIINGLRGFENTEKTVAFFYIGADGTVSVRGPSDYVPKMIEIAGGRYVFDDLGGAEDAQRSTVSMTMEEFYHRAVNADYLIYNATIDQPLQDMQDLLDKSGLFADFKAVKEGNVWCTGKYLYQATDIIGNLITDIHLMLTGAQDGMTFLARIE